MNILFVLIPASILIAGAFLGAFLWAVRDGQWDDDYTPSVRILFEQEPLEKDQEVNDGSTEAPSTAHPNSKS